MSASEPTAPIQPGAIVELHSLSTAALNGLRAEAGELDVSKGRRAAVLADGRFLGVKVLKPYGNLCIGLALWMMVGRVVPSAGCGRLEGSAPGFFLLNSL